MNTTDFDHATLDWCRDFIAEAMGWEKRHPPNCNWFHPEYKWSVEHPVPETLGAIAGYLPNGWLWNEIKWFNGSQLWIARAFRFDPWDAVGADADTEILARARCCCLAWESAKEPA